MSIKDGKGKNVGDWSEIYVFFRVMETGRLQSADAEMHPIAAAYLPVLKIIREEENGRINDYYTATGDGDRKMQVYSNGELVCDCTVDEFKSAANDLLENLQNAVADKGTKKSSMHFPEIEDFLESIRVYTIKAPSRAISESFGGKSDITMLVQQKDGLITTAGFSIKSSLSSPATLGNSSNACNFYYELPGCTDALMNEVNAIEGDAKIVRRAKRIAAAGINPVFSGVGSQTFANNLLLVDANMGFILARAMWLAYYKSDGGRGSKKDLVSAIDLLCKDDPLEIGKNGEEFCRVLYRKKIADYLMAVSCSMNPNEAWNGTSVIKGGYVFVTKRGEVLAYYAADEDLFKDFLVENVKFESPSSSRRANDANGMSLGKIVKKDDSYYFTLNLQLRFTS